MLLWRSGLDETKPTALAPRRRPAPQISDSASASGKRSPFNTSATLPGLTRKAAAMLWIASPRRRRFQISIASGKVSGGDVGEARGIFGRDFGCMVLPCPSREMASGTGKGSDRFGSDVIGGIEYLSRRKAACQTRWTGYVKHRGAESRVATAAAIQLRRAALPGAALLCVWHHYHGVAWGVLQGESPVYSLPDCPSKAHNRRHSGRRVVPGCRWLGGHIEGELWTAKHNDICRIPPNQSPAIGNSVWWSA